MGRTRQKDSFLGCKLFPSYKLNNNANIRRLKQRAARPEPKGADAYFTKGENSQTVSLDKIIHREKANPERLRRAKKSMESSAAGLVEKRRPLHVVQRGDGTFKLLDGNTTLQALKDFGETSAVVEIVPPYQRGVQTMDELYAQAAKAQPELKKLGQSLVKKHGGALMMRDGLKDRARAFEKARDDYKGDHSRLTDINGATLVFDTVEEAKAAFEDFRKDPRVMKDKNRYENPVGGYRDFFLLVQLPNGHIAEMQFNTAKMIAAKEGLGHTIYDLSRAVDDEIKAGRVDGSEVISELNRLSDVSKKFYDLAFEYAISDFTKLSQSVREISDELNNILDTLPPVISDQSSGAIPSALNSLRSFLSKTKGTSSFSRYLNSDILPPPFKANIQHMIDGVNASGDTPRFSREKENDDIGRAVKELNELRYARGSKMARNAAKEFVNKPLENIDSGVMATVSGNTLSKMLSRSSVDGSHSPQAHMQAVANLDTLFRHAVERLKRQDRVGGEGIKYMHHFDAPMPFDGDILRVKMLVKEFSDSGRGARIYTVQAITIEKPGSLIGGPVPEQSPGPESDQLPGFNKKFITLLDAVKTAQHNQTSQNINDNILFRRVMHGTSKRGINRFELSKIGTGHGKQAYGWGMYFTASKDMAEAYKGKEGGQVYEADIPDDEHLLDNDAPLSRQSQEVKAALKKLPKPVAEKVRRVGAGNMTGEDLYNELAKYFMRTRKGENNQRLASLYLDKQGIHGLRYKGMGKTSDSGKGTQNYVVWNEDVINIVREYYRRNGQADPAPSGVKAADVRKVLEPLQSRAVNALPTEVVQSQSDLPQHILDSLDEAGGGRINGVFDPQTGKIYLVADNISKPGDAAEAWMTNAVRYWRHEQGHHGLRGFFSDTFGPQWGKQFQNFLGYVREHYKDTDAYKETEKLYKGQDRFIVAEEFFMSNVVEKVAYGQKLNATENGLWQRFVKFVKRLLGQFAPNETYEQDELERVAMGIFGWLEGGQQAQGAQGAAMFNKFYPVRSKAFEEWFGNSEVVDEEGEPLVVYHGTGAQFTIFDAEKGDAPGFWFTDDKDFAKRFAGKDGGVLSVYLNIENPLDLSNISSFDAYDVDTWKAILEEAGLDTSDIEFDSTAFAEDVEYAFSDLLPNKGNSTNNDGNLIAEMQRQGFDGIKAPAEFGDEGVFVVFSPNQVKSATENVGTFDPSNNDIRFSKQIESAGESFRSQLEIMQRGDLSSQDVLQLGRTPQILARIGEKDLPVTMPQSVAKKAMGGKHALSQETLGNIVEAINDPIMVFDSKSTADSLVVMTELKDKNGKTVMAAIHLDRKEQRHRINQISSVYGRNTDYDFVNWRREGLTRYWNKKKSLGWARSRGLQLPKLGPNRGGHTISKNADDVYLNSPLSIAFP